MLKKDHAASPEAHQDFVVVGWREWVAIPGLEIPAIKAKVDTGARTSALHTYFIEPFDGPAGPMVRFGVHPEQHHDNPAFIREAPILDHRDVTDSGGHREERIFIRTLVQVGPIQFESELSLTNRDRMRFRMLLGRTAMEGRILVNPGVSYVHGKALAQAYKPKGT